MTSSTVTLRAPGQAGPPLPDHAELLLEEFLASRRLGGSTQQIYRQALQAWERGVDKPLEGADVQTVATWYARLSGYGYAASTSLTYTVKLRALYEWTLRRRGVKRRTAATQAAELFEEVPMADLKRQADRENKLRDKVVTPDEYEALMGAVDHPRLRALLVTLYESAARPGEVLGLRIRDVDFRDRYAQVRVSGKTGERTVPLVRAIPYLRAWLQVHPQGEDPDAPLFARVYRGRVAAITLNTLEALFHRLWRKAGVKRRVYPYMFRHTRLTELADNDLGEFKMKELAGWTTDSRMAARYVHLSGRSSLAPILEMEGIEVPDEARPRESPIRVRACPRCGSRNEGDARYCSACSLALDQVVALADQAMGAEEDAALSRLLDDPRVQEAVTRALRDLVAGGALGGLGGPRGGKG